MKEGFDVALKEVTVRQNFPPTHPHRCISTSCVIAMECGDDDIDCKCVCVGWRVTNQTREGGDIQVVEV